MKKLALLLFPLFLLSSDSIFVENNSQQMEKNNNNSTLDQENSLIDLNMIQKSFLKLKNGDLNSILNINFKQNKTYRIHTRLLMNTLIILDNDSIVNNPIYGNKGFNITKLGIGKYDLSNMLLIQPKFVGIDTNLILLGKSGNIYSFYLYSTDHTSKENPDTVVFVSETRKKINKINIVNLEEKNFNKKTIIETESKKEIKDPDYFYVGEGKNRIKVYKDQVIKDFVQDGAEELKAKEIFRDNKFVYFKYDKDFSLSSFPAIFEVVNGFDSPTNFRVIGDYLVAETIANKFTLKIENKHVCVRRLKDIDHEEK